MGERQLLAYGRFTEEEKIVVVVNNGDSSRTVSVPVWRLGVPMSGAMERLLYSYETGYTTEAERYQVQEGNIHLNMGRFSAIVIRYLGEEKKHE